MKDINKYALAAIMLAGLVVVLVAGKLIMGMEVCR